jgi:DNA-binding transcriptional LysR family regulator
MEMHQVRYFLAVAQERNFTRAAERCNVTQPSLTRAIQKLEEEFGGQLFRRERALTHLTELGRLMLPHLERSYEAAQQARALARQVERAQLAPLSLGIATDIHLPGLPMHFMDLGRSFSGFELSLVCAESPALVEAALAGDVDVIIADLPGDVSDRVDRWELFQDSYGLLLRTDHPLSRSGGLALEDLAGLAFVGIGTETGTRLAGRLPVLPDIVHHAGSIAAAGLLVAGGLGAALVPDTMAFPAETAWRPVEGLAIERTVAVAAVAGRRRSVAADAFVKSVRARGWGHPAL